MGVALKNIACLGHPVPILHHLPDNERAAYASAKGFHERHGKATCEIAYNLLTADEYRRLSQGDVKIIEEYRSNADVKLAFQAAQSMTVTNLHSLASSATAGWQSAVVDNTSNLYLDALGMVVIDHANTAPANSKGHYIFAYSGLESGTYTNPASGSEGALTLLDVTANLQAMRLAHFLPYTTADEIAESAVFSIAAAFGGILPPYWGLAIINHTGAAIHSSGSTVKYRGQYATVV